MSCRAAALLAAAAFAANFDLAIMASSMHDTEEEADAAAEAMGCSGSHKMGDKWMTGVKHGCCDSEPSWEVVDGGYAPMNLDPGDTITFNFYQFAHDVVALDEYGYENCVFADKKVLVDAKGEDVADGTVAIDGNKISYVWAPTEDGTYYLSCTVGKHCMRGQKLKVVVGGDGPAGYVREGHVSTKHDHSSHGHDDHDHHHRRLSEVSCELAETTEAPHDDHDHESLASVFVSALFLAGLTW
jgi:hypothetical protein